MERCVLRKGGGGGAGHAERKREISTYRDTVAEHMETGTEGNRSEDSV